MCLLSAANDLIMFVVALETLSLPSYLLAAFFRDYRRNPYADYAQTRDLMFSVSNTAPPNFHPKEQVLGLNAGGIFKAYPFVELNKHGHSSFKDKINGREFVIHWNQEHQAGRIFDTEGSEVTVITGFWFAWYAFHPETQVFKASDTQL